MSNAVVKRPADASFPRMGRLSWLMELYGENHRRLARMFDTEQLALGAWTSSVGDGVDLHLDVLERHAYTVDLRMTYGMTDPATGVRDPSTFVRVYRDARQAEATHCYIGQRWQDVLGLRPDPQVLVGHRLRMNTFLGKWLEFLADQGHSRFTLRQVEADAPDPTDANWLPSALLGA
jgi:hypothetical protein